MFFDLVAALLAAVAAGVAPGWFWAKFLGVSSDRAERLAFAVALSLGLVSAAALALSSFFGSGVTLAVAISAVLIVFLSGLAASLAFPPAKDLENTLSEPENSEYSAASRSRWRAALFLVMTLVAARAYVGPVLHDWPYIRGIDQYIQSVMVNITLSGGEVEEFMVYPAGFHAFLASVSWMGGLEPLELFPVLGPAFLLLPPLALYALGRRIWGVPVGVAAAFFSGVILASSYQYLIEARYLHMTAAQFFMVLAVAAMLRLVAAPSFRSGALFAVVGSSTVLYHHVGSFYLALLLGLLAVGFIPYLLLRKRRAGVVFLASLAALGAISIFHAWDTYDLPGFAANLVGGSSDPTGAAVFGAIGSQEPYSLLHLPIAVSPSVLWIGLLGAALLFMEKRKAGVPYTFAKVAVAVWAAIMFLGSRTAFSGFPERFERDLGVPLALLAAFAVVGVFRFVTGGERRGSVGRFAVAAVVLVSASVVFQTAANFVWAASPAPEEVRATARISMTPEFEAAGEWLEENNEGGNIIASPYFDGLPSRAMLAMGRYTAVQTFVSGRIRLNRDLPPSGQRPPRDALFAMENPESERARETIEEFDVRYIVLYKRHEDTDWRDFESRPDLYRKTFENDSVAIFAPA
ncbi:MAG: hypothetical protein H0U65_05380 [Rubrobacter sp.]|nr:hypothetical protein [Rubrobacter sp.]